MKKISEADRERLKGKIDEVEEEMHARMHELETKADPRPGIFRAPWWAWVLTVVGIILIWELVKYIEAFVLRAQ